MVFHINCLDKHAISGTLLNQQGIYNKLTMLEVSSNLAERRTKSATKRLQHLSTNQVSMHCIFHLSFRE